MSFRVTKPRRFVAEWLVFHRHNVIAIKQLFYAHLVAKKRAARMAVKALRSVRYG